eukprot:IDg18228t1
MISAILGHSVEIAVSREYGNAAARSLCTLRGVCILPWEWRKAVTKRRVDCHVVAVRLIERRINTWKRSARSSIQPTLLCTTVLYTTSSQHLTANNMSDRLPATDVRHEAEPSKTIPTRSSVEYGTIDIVWKPTM